MCVEMGPAPCTAEAGAHLPSLRLPSRTLPFRLGETGGGTGPLGHSRMEFQQKPLCCPPHTPLQGGKQSPRNLSAPRRCAVLITCVWLKIKGISCMPACCPSPSSGHTRPLRAVTSSEAWSAGYGPRPATTSMSPSQVFIESGRNLSTFYENQLLTLRLLREARKFDLS